ncbi:hypothetical protein N9W89_01780 [Hellea sp.]|nr:hypothetical protein [Hellea sp.]
MAKSWLSPTPPPDAHEPPKPLLSRMMWMAIFMLSGVAVVAGSAYFLRSLLFL